jgi:hypothetical protein
VASAQIIPEGRHKHDNYTDDDDGAVEASSKRLTDFESYPLDNNYRKASQHVSGDSAAADEIWQALPPWA